MMPSFIHYLPVMQTCMTYTYTGEHVIATVHVTAVKCDIESSYTSYCLFLISLFNRTMHHIVPTNEHQDGSVARPDHVLFTDVHTVVSPGRTVACRSQLSEG